MNRLQTLGTTAQKWLADDVYDVRKFEQEFNYKTSFDLKEGLRREVAFYRTEQAKRGS
jgi:nucleoside-diphosphate-sugar epimerase